MTIKELRESKGLSQGKFAESIGIGRTAIVGYEKGKFKPKDEVIAKIKEVYGVDVTDNVAVTPSPVEEAKTAKRTRKKKEEQTAPVIGEKGETNIGAAIKALRTAKGLSQKAFGETIGVKLPTVGAYEGGRIKPSDAVMAKIKEVYGEDALEAAVATPALEAPAAEKPAKRGSRKTAPAVEEKKPAKREKKAALAEEAALVIKEKKPRGRKNVASIIIQSPLGGSITPEEILEKTGPVDAVYIRVDENKAYWVRGDETGSVELW